MKRLNSTPFTLKEGLEICKPYQNDFGIIYFMKGENLEYSFDGLYVLNLEENKYDVKDKICIMLDEEQKKVIDAILEKIKKKLAIQM